MRILLFSFLLASIVVTLIFVGIIGVNKLVYEKNKQQNNQLNVDVYIDEDYPNKRIPHNYIDTTGYYDTVIFTEEDSLLSGY